MSVENELIALEQRFWETAGDPRFYEERFADDGAMAFSIGVMGKEEVVAAMDGAGEWERFTMDDVRFVAISSEVAALVYTTVARAAGEGHDYAAAVTSVYVKRQGRWMLILHQQSPLAQAPG